MRRTARLGTWALLAVLTLLAGCSVPLPPQTVDGPKKPPATVHPAWPGCRALGAFAQLDIGDNDTPGSGSIPSGFTPAVAVSCEYRTERGDHDPPYLTGLERRATDIDGLVTYLHRRDQRSTRPNDLACRAMAWFRPWLFLQDRRGRWISPHIPTDPCGFPLDMFSEPRRLPWTTLTYADRVVCSTDRTSDRPCR